MKIISVRLLALLITVLALAASLPAEEPAKPKQFIYVLHLVPRLFDDKSWTEADKAAVGRHFNRLKAAAETGEMILAGRTPESGDKTFGIVIFDAKDEAAAKRFMDDDPAVVAGIMTAELHPFALALQRKK
ncbi:MAG TPA: YciI family protein [Chthoniobacterales bacterium]|jgi:YCII-related domain.|nr:YciI family protein [Chthoniobacterales bacterium]